MFRWQTIVKLLVTCNFLAFMIIFIHKSAFDSSVRTTRVSNELQSSGKQSAAPHQDSIADSKTPRDGTAVGNSGGKLIVDYVSLASCRKPTFVSGLKASCWYDCKTKDGCTGKLNYPEWEDLVLNGRATRHCFPSQHLIGIRKCGTTDLAKWFQYQSPNHEVTVKDISVGSRLKCPDSIFNAPARYDPTTQRWFNYGPGNIMLSFVHTQNDTHMTVLSAIHLISFMNEPNSRYILSLRNPTDRLISYIFHAHKMKWIYSNIDAKSFNAQFIHGIIVELVKELKNCLIYRGELVCVHLENSRDGNLKAAIRHGLYVVYVQELFKFVPREQVYINHLEEYATNQTIFSEKIMDFFSEKITWTENAIMTAHKTRNCGSKTEVDDKTLRLLDELYLPFNRRLAILLDHPKWMFDRTSFKKPTGTFCG